MNCSACKKGFSEDGVWTKTVKNGTLLLHYDCEAEDGTERGKRAECYKCGKSWRGDGWAFHLDGDLFHRGCWEGEEGVDPDAFKAAEEFHEEWIDRVAETKKRREENVGVAADPFSQLGKMLSQLIQENGGGMTAKELKSFCRPGKQNPYFQSWSEEALTAWADRFCLAFYEYNSLLIRETEGRGVVYYRNPAMIGVKAMKGRKIEEMAEKSHVPLRGGTLARRILGAFDEQPDRPRMTAAQMTHYLGMRSVAKMEFNMLRMNLWKMDETEDRKRKGPLFLVPDTNPPEFISRKARHKRSPEGGW